MTPFIPPLASAHLPSPGGQLGPLAEHFQVEEIPAYAPSGEGDHVYVWVEKVGKNTADTALALARAAGVPVREVGYAGLKDRHAVTRQWFSLPVPAQRTLDPSCFELGEEIRVLELTRHKNKLRTGHLIGNRFQITLVQVEPSGLPAAQAIAEWIQTRGLGNYFGPQRFGRAGSNLDRAWEWLQGERKNSRFSHKQRFEQKMLPSVVQSEIFNRYTAERLAHPAPLLRGEVVRLHGSGKHFIVEDPEQELPRLQAGDLHLTGPLPGPKTLQEQAEAAELQERIFTQLGLGEDQLARLAQGAPGARRDLLLHPEDLQLKQTQPGELQLSFSLPAGSYASQVLREFTRQAWDEFRAPTATSESTAASE